MVHSFDIARLAHQQPVTTTGLYDYVYESDHNTDLVVRNSTMSDIQMQRDSVSKRAMKLMQRFMKYYCEIQKRKGSKVSMFGGWCLEAGSKGGGEHATDKTLIQFLKTFFQGKHVGSFGDGPGEYKRLLDKTGLLASYTAYDGSPYAAENSEGRVSHLDLTIAAFGLPAFDWVISLEVAEHIPALFERQFLDNLVRHAKEGVILSWAVPGQGGLSHVNNRKLTYVIHAFDSLGFYHDLEASEMVQAACSLSWLKRNVNVYRRKPNNPIKPEFL